MNKEQGAFFFRPMSFIASFLVAVFVLIAIYAPFLASSKPIVVIYHDELYFPLFRYLFYPGYYTKALDRFYNVLIFVFPLYWFLFFLWPKHRWNTFLALVILQITVFSWIEWFPPKDPAFASASDVQEELGWDHYSAYKKINQLVEYRNTRLSHESLLPYTDEYAKRLAKRKGEVEVATPASLPTLWNLQNRYLKEETVREQGKGSLWQKRDRLTNEEPHLSFVLMPLIRPYHFEEDVGGNQLLNQVVPWYELTRGNRKDLVAALIFGTRISIVVGVASVCIALLIGIPLGATAGFFGGKVDLFLSRWLEVWEGMPTFFMLLMIVAITETKSIAWIILIIGLFGWTSYARFVRGETLKIKPLAYIQVCKALGFGPLKTLFHHLLPNALTSVITLLPFSVMAAISAESGLAFLGLGEEGSCSWGVLMDEGRSNFPAQSALLWPPALMLTTLLVSLAILGDTLRDALDPRVKLCP